MTAYKVKVGEVKPTGKHKTPWAITWPTNAEKKRSMGSITFDPSDNTVWEGASPPEPSDFLVVWDVRGRARGYRAYKARPFREGDAGDPNIIQ